MQKYLIRYIKTNFEEAYLSSHSVVTLWSFGGHSVVIRLSYNIVHTENKKRPIANS